MNNEQRKAGRRKENNKTLSARAAQRDARGEKRLSVPAVERPVVTGLAARREHKVVPDVVSTTEPVVGVDPGARSVEEDVAVDSRERRLGLDKEGGLVGKRMETY